MPKVSFTKDERANLLLRQVQTQEEYNRVVDDEYARNPNHPDENRISAALALVTQAGELYEAGLHRVRMSVCPFSHQPFEWPVVHRVPALLFSAQRRSVCGRPPAQGSPLRQGIDRTGGSRT
jgi:hypothetical protein